MSSYNTSGPVSSVASSNTLTLDALIGGDKWGGAVGTGVTVSYSFPWQSGSSAYWYQDSNGDYSTDNEPSAAQHYGLNSTQMNAARDALLAWANVANIQFQQVLTESSTNVGDIRFAWSSAVPSGFWGHSYYPQASFPQGGDIWLNPSNTGGTDTDWLVGSYNYEALMHEIGHALGLKHPGNYSGSETGPFFSSATGTAYLDNRLYTLMSYSDPSNDLFRTITYHADGSYQWQVYGINPQTPMVLDIAVIQYLYGANTSYRTGNDVYTFDPASPFFKTIWDAGGHDTISVSNFTQGCTIDLTPGDYSSIKILPTPAPANYTGPPTTYDGTGNLGIAYGAIIEEAIGGSGNDTLIGNSAANTLSGRGGNDTIDGAAGIDIASYTGARANFTLTKTSTGYTVSDHTAAEGTDTLANIERLQFSNRELAVDLSGTGHAAETVEILGSAFGKTFVSNKDYVAAGLALFDAGTSLHDVCVAAIGTPEFKSLAGSTGNVDFVNTVYRNVVGVLPQQADLNHYVGLLQGGGGTMSQADLLLLAATCPENLAHIDLVGLQQSGVEYT